MAAVVESLERDMELLCVTGVEDTLHDGVRSTLELLRNAGIKVSHFWPVILTACTTRLKQQISHETI